MQKAIIVAVSLAVAFFSFSGKEIYKNDISNRLIIQGIGIDSEPDGSYTVTLQAINTNAQSASVSESSSDKTVKIYKVNDKTVYSAMKSVIEYEGKVPLYSQNRIIVISKAIALSGIENVIDFFVRDADMSPSVYIAMTDGRAEDILSVEIEGEIMPKNVDLAIQSAEYEPEIFRLELYDLVNRYEDELSCFAMPVLSSVEESENQKSVQVSKTALFCDGKYKTDISRDETIMLNFLANNIYNGDFSYETEEREKVSLNIINSRTIRTVEFSADKLSFNIKIKVDADIAEVYDGLEKSADIERLAYIEEAGEAYLKTQLISTIQKIIEKNSCDSVGFSKLLYICKPKFYREQKENLNTVLKDAEYNVEVNIVLRRVGQEFIET